MAKSNEEILDDRVVATAEAALEAFGPSITRLTIDFTASGELPYRAETPEETLPLIGLARREAAGDVEGDSVSTVAQSRKRGDS